MGNRVEELERKVAALEATVDGLTEELVETKERLAQVEAAADVEIEVETDDEAGSAHAEFVPNADRAATAEAAAPETGADAEAADADDGGSEAAADGGSEAAADGGSDDDSDDDIIVA